MRTEIFGAYGVVQRMVRDTRWKLIHYPKIDRRQLFDLANDPGEVDDVSDLPVHAQRVTELMERLARLQREFGDTLASR